MLLAKKTKKKQKKQQTKKKKSVSSSAFAVLPRILQSLSYQTIFEINNNRKRKEKS